MLLSYKMVIIKIRRNDGDDEDGKTVFEDSRYVPQKIQLCKPKVAETIMKDFYDDDVIHETYWQISAERDTSRNFRSKYRTDLSTTKSSNGFHDKYFSHLSRRPRRSVSTVDSKRNTESDETTH